MLARFRMYSALAQLILWVGGAWIMGAMLSYLPRNLRHRKVVAATVEDTEKETVSA
ncbi:hypothetical protein [Acidipropionibacterium jensenii]|uniref:hypothetical protein n=1 Tax=Acidipropionibacterium jensenii TaxID=1749 RepID=UPI00214CC105|nr:hypothetical protein [Acidipropionibacterium jensenii]